MDDVALPGLDELTARRRSKTETGYITHLAQLSYPDGWRFWALAHLGGDLRKHAGNYRADEVQTVFLTRDQDWRTRHQGDRSDLNHLCRALIVIETGEILHIEPYPKPVMRR